MKNRGFVYVMRSPAVTWSKIGLSTRAPHFRAKELSKDPVYGSIGPWEVVDYRQVEDRFASEKALHRHFAGQKKRHLTASELFDVPVEVACAKLIEVAAHNLTRGDLIGRLRLEPELVRYLSTLYRVTGLSQFADLQEAWTFSLFPSTAGGRWFTLNIDRHEVAWAAPVKHSDQNDFMLYMDSRAARSLSFTKWKWKRGAWSLPFVYKSAGPRSVSVCWRSSWAEALEIFEIQPVRRALIGYWYDSLLDLRDRKKQSFFAKSHNHNAVQEILQRL